MNNVLRTRLLALLDERGLNAKQLAERARVAPSTISRLLTGDTRDLQASTFRKLEAELGVPPGELLLLWAYGAATQAPETLGSAAQRAEAALWQLDYPVGLRRALVQLVRTMTEFQDDLIRARLDEFGPADLAETLATQDTGTIEETARNVYYGIRAMMLAPRTTDRPHPVAIEDADDATEDMDGSGGLASPDG